MRLFFIAFLISLCTVCFSQTKAHKQSLKMPMSLFTRVHVIDVETGQVLRDMDVLVDDARIISIRKHQKGNMVPPKGVHIIPSQGKYLMPGLVDCHTHIFYKEDLIHYLSNGVTTVFSLGQPSGVLEYREEVKQHKLAGPSIYAAALLDTVPQDWDGRIYNYVVHSVTDVPTAMDKIQKEKYDLIKVYNSLTTEEFDEIMRLAKIYGMPVIGHGVRQPGMEHILSKGMAMVAHGEEYLYTVFKDSLDERQIPAAVAFTKKYGAYVCANLSTFHTIAEQWGDSLKFAALLDEAGNIQHRVSPGILNFWMNNNRYIHRQGSPLTPMYLFLQKFVYALYQAGVPLVAGTDSPIIPGCLPGYSLVKDLEQLNEAGISNADALKSATLVPGQFIAQYIRNAPKTGAVKKGYQADLLLLSKNPLNDLQHLRMIEGVMVRGKWYGREGLRG